MTATMAATSVGLDLQGRTAKAHIDKWTQYGVKAQQHATAAGLILAEVKASLPHGQYTPWLRTHGIEPRTAQRLVLETKEPAKRTERQERQRERDRTARATPKHDTRDAFETTSLGDDQRDWIIDYVRNAPLGEVAQLYNLLHT